MSIVEGPLAESTRTSQRPSPQQPSPDRLTPITLAMYDRMIEAGVFEPAETHPLELIGGQLHMMSPIGDRHADAVAFLTRWSSQCLDHGQMMVWVQNPLAMPSSQSAPQPDVAWVKLRRYADRRPLPEDVSLVIEVADTSLEFDMTVKAALYAAAGITDYWVVDLTSRGVIMFRDPRDGRYETQSTHRGDQLVSPLALPTASLSPAELFVPE